MGLKNMNGNFLKRLIMLAMVSLLLPLSSASYAQAKSEAYDTKQFIDDVATLYRQHKLDIVADQLSEEVTAHTTLFGETVKIAKKKVADNRVASAKKAQEAKKKSEGFKNQMTVTATAYTSHVNQTDSTPNIAAWGDRLKPGMKVIAVSRDMLNKYGLKHRSKVRIKGLDGEYLVLDKMNKRWKKKIDIYMGMDLKKAYKWGKRKVELQWN